MNDDTDILKIDKTIQNVIFDRYPAEAVRLIEQMDMDEIIGIFAAHDVREMVKIWERISPMTGAAILKQLPENYTVRLLERLDPNRAANLLKNLDETTREQLLDALKPAAARDLRRAISFEENSAGALMDVRVLYFRPDMTVSETINVLRTQLKKNYRKIYTVDGENHLVGMIEMEDLVLADQDARLSEIQKESPAVVQVTTGREEVVTLFERYKLTDMPVVDFDKRLVGVIRYHVLVDAVREESSMNLQTMVGVSKDERALSPPMFAVKKRLPWLEINLLTAFLAAAVVGAFEDTIAQYTALAVLLPVVAGQSGNTGAQALAVTMRGLALREIYPRMWFRILYKEFNVGLWNGIAVALTTGAGVYVWSQSIGLTLVIFVSMILSMVIASISGAGIPILLTITGQDPAQSSSIFLTTVTDIAGFFSFLGIATLFIALL